MTARRSILPEFPLISPKLAPAGPLVRPVQKSFEIKIDLNAFAAKDRAIARAVKAELPGWSIVYFDEAAAARADYRAQLQEFQIEMPSASSSHSSPRTTHMPTPIHRQAMRLLRAGRSGQRLGPRPRRRLYNDAVCEARIMPGKRQTVCAANGCGRWALAAGRHGCAHACRHRSVGRAQGCTGIA